MITVVIPTLNAEEGLPATLTSLVPAAISGLVREVIIVDGGSTDRTLQIADDAGATVVQATGGRGAQLKAGAERARFPWLLFLHADTVLDGDWEREADGFMERVDKGIRPATAAAFRFSLDDTGFKPRLIEAFVHLRCSVFRLPYGDQGLLIPKALYDQLGGFKPIPLMEDVEIVRSLGRRRLMLLRSRTVTSAARYQRDGYVLRPLRNLLCLTLYFCKVPPAKLLRIYR